MTKTRTGWAHTLTLASLAALSAAGAMLSMRSGTPGKADLAVASVPPVSSGVLGGASGAAPMFPGLADALGKVDAMHREMIERRIEATLRNQTMAKMSACFAPGTPNEVMEAFRATEARLNHFDDRFQIAPRWQSTAYTPGGSPLGKPVTISWSIVPDGTFVQGFNGEPDAPSNLRAYLDGIYGNEATWLPIIQSVFDRWSQVTGLQYVYEPTDDGQALQSPGGGNSPFFGVPGVRGDVRISGHTIDGNSGVLAYNFYPDINDALGGDMVIDTGDNFFFTTTGNSVRLRDVMMHEHGHGIGQAHVCPIETTKLMEPFVSTIFDGPRHDDIRHGQYSYGDVNEPNDFAAEATDLGSLDCASVSVGDMPAPVGPIAGAITETPIASTVSLSDSNDDDFYKVTVSSAATLNVVVTPLGLAYDDSAQACSGQSGSCCSGSPTDSLNPLDLAINILEADGTTLVASANGAGAGAAEQLSNILLPVAGTYYIQVKSAGGGGKAQFYHLNASATPATVLAGLTGDQDIAVPAGVLVPVALKINNGTEVFDLGASHFYYSLNGGATFLEAPMYDQGGGTVVAALADVPCGGSLQFYVEVRSTLGSLVRLPCSGVYTPRTGDVFNTYSTDFTTNAAGWVVGPNTATTGIWVNDVPIGSAAQPGADHTGPGGKCFITGQGAIGNSAGAFDIDGGSTLLTSPTLNLAGMQDAEISYWRWYSTGAGGAPYADTFIIQASVNGGGSWTTAEIVGPGSVTDPNVNPGWRFKSFKLSSLGLVPSANVKVRFNAQDTGTGSVVEAALDDFAAVGFSCNPVTWCIGDLNLDGLVEDFDFVVFAAAYNILDCEDPTMPAGCPSDLNGDGFVDDADFVLFAAAYNELICP
ncbi:MAG: matrixin family metalloprotease [Phycisphaeraceae bacterium]|nr:matrixin family metalloprotease [Phycisphaeraceae bacterium]